MTAAAAAPPHCSAGALLHAQQVMYTTTKGLDASTRNSPPACQAQQALCSNLHRLRGQFSLRALTLSRLKTLPAGSTGHRSTMPQAAPSRGPTHTAGAGRCHLNQHTHTHTPPCEHTPVPHHRNIASAKQPQLTTPLVKSQV